MGLRFEPLEERLAFSVWQNADLPCDVDRSGLVAPIDMLQVINEINLSGNRSLADSPPQLGRPVDTNGDGLLSPVDALLIINALNRYAGTLSVEFAPPAADPDRNGVLASQSVMLMGSTLPEVELRLSVEGQAFATVMSNAEGNFVFAGVPLHSTATSILVTAHDPRGRSSTDHLSLRSGDAVANWNASALVIVRDWQTVDEAGRVGRSPPPMVARNLAMIHAAMFDAVNAYGREYEPYLQDLPQPPDGSSPQAAAAAAAHAVASALYPAAAERAVWDATLEECRLAVNDAAAWDAGAAFGGSVGQAMLQLRAGDGSGDVVEYTHGSRPESWRKTFPGYLPASLPQWPGVTPFSLPSFDGFQVPAPLPLLGDDYALSVDEVMRLGGVDSSERTADQTAIARFWAGGGGTATPPGQWNRIAAEVAAGRDLPLVESARLLAALNLALADAGIAAWETKYTYNFWRPIDAIRRAADDGNPTTAADPAWTPLLDTPPFPSYVSGHSTFSGAAAAVLTALLGEHVAFSITADPAGMPLQRLQPTATLESRSFGSFREAAEEAGMSRIYGGIHYDFDNTAGLELGEALGLHVVANFLRPV